MIVIFKIQLQTLSGTEVSAVKRRQMIAASCKVFLLNNSRLIPSYALDIYNKARKSSFGSLKKNKRK